MAALIRMPIFVRRMTSTSTKIVDHAPSAASHGFDGVPVELDPVCSKFINYMMYDGKKSLAQKIFTDTLTLIKSAEMARLNLAVKAKVVQTTAENQPQAAQDAPIANVKPLIGLTKLRKGGQILQVPTPLTDRRSNSLAMKWIIQAARDKKGKPMEEKLFVELMDAFKNEGSAIKKKVEMHKMAEGNRTNMRFK